MARPVQPPEPKSAPGEGGPGEGETDVADEREYRCDICGAVMLEEHCKLRCLVCGYTRDCSDP
jgi:hypothetical protein